MITLKNIERTYDLGSSQVSALRGVDVTVNKGEFLCIMGASGSGKSTLLHILGMLDTPSNGSYLLEGTDVTNIPDKERARIRNRHMGFVFQSFNLLNELSALENVELPMVYAGLPERERRQRAKDLLVRLGLEHRLSHLPVMMSGGEQQRVAICRALANEPNIILADEPTGNLPSETGKAILDILKDLNKAGTTVVMVTHDPILGRLGSRTIIMKDGQITEEERR